MKARENPFRSERVEALAYRAEGFDWKKLEDKLAASKGRGAIIGPQGHGKTTLLLEWQHRCEARRENTLFLRLTEGRRRLSAVQKSQIAGRSHIFVDSVEQLGWWGRKELLWETRRAARLVVTSHQATFLPTLFICETSPLLLSELVRELTGKPDSDPNLWSRHRGNIRLALRELYDARAASKIV